MAQKAPNLSLILSQNTLSSNYYNPSKNKRNENCVQIQTDETKYGCLNLQKIFTICFGQEIV